MTNYRITFEKNGVYQANMAIAENEEDVRRDCEKKNKNIIAINEANESEMNEAARKGMPIITIEHIEENKEDEEMTRTNEEIREEIKKYFKEHEDEYNEVIEDLDGYNGYLGDDRYWNMEDLDELYNGTEPTEILTRAFYGYDEMYQDENGNHPEPFNPNRDYFRYNGYGNLVSTDCKDYSGRLDNYFIDEVIDNADNLDTIPDEVKELIEEIEAIEA